MAVIQLTAREFREKQASVFDLLDAGEKVIIRRGKKKSYTLVPVEEAGLEISKELQSKINLSLEEIKKEECISFTDINELEKHFDEQICTK